MKGVLVFNASSNKILHSKEFFTNKRLSMSAQIIKSLKSLTFCLITKKVRTTTLGIAGFLNKNQKDSL